MIAWLLVVLACGAPTAAPVPNVEEAVASPAPPVEEAVASDDAPLRFVERLLGTDDGSVPLPTVIVVHGLGDRAERIVGLMDGLQGKVRVLAPQAPKAWHDGGTWFTTRVQRADPVVLGEEMLHVADRVVAWIDEVSATHPIAGKPVITGFSQGGMVSFAVALRHPEAVAGAVPIAGWLPAALVSADPTPAQRALPIRAFHGKQDRVLSFVSTRRAVDAMRASGFDATLTAREGVGHAVPAELRTAVTHAVQELLPPSP